MSDSSPESHVWGVQGRAEGLGLALGGGGALPRVWGAGPARLWALQLPVPRPTHTSPRRPPPPLNVLWPLHQLSNAGKNLHSLKRTPRDDAKERPKRHGGHVSPRPTNKHADSIRMLNNQLHVVDL